MIRRVALFHLRQQTTSPVFIFVALLVTVTVFANIVIWGFLHGAFGPGGYCRWGDEPFGVWEVSIGSLQSIFRYIVTARGSVGLVATALMQSIYVWIFVLPLLGFIFSYNGVSDDLESGRVLSLHTLPLSSSDLAVGRALGNGLAVILSLVAGIGVAAGIGWWWLSRFVPIGLDLADLVRSGLYISFLAVYTLVFVLLGTLISTLTRHSKVALLICLVVFLGIFILHLARENSVLFDAPLPPTGDQVIRTYFMGFGGRQGPIEAQRVAAEALKHMEELFPQIRRHYRIERLLNFLSPANLHIEVASALLQDRFIPPYRIFAPVPLDEAQATIGQSLRYLLPEILFTLVMIMLLFWLNVRALTKLEV